MNKVRVQNILMNQPFLAGLAIRFALMYALPRLLDDGILLQGVKYTDIDYLVFTDAARYVKNGLNPFQRHTYRYTPFLALLLSYADMDTDKNTENATYSWFWWWKHEKYFGKILFCVADALCGLIVVKLRRKNRNRDRDHNSNCGRPCDDGNEDDTNAKIVRIPIQLQDALWWAFNPLAINICTRGSAESFIVLLSVITTVAISMARVRSKLALRMNAIVAGVIHGIAIHAKLYPIIYTASFMTYFSYREHDSKWKNVMEPIQQGIGTSTWKKKNPNPYPFPWLDISRLMKLIKLWIQRLLKPSPILFLAFSMATFASLTYLAVLFYGDVAMEEGLLYHFSRVDHRHNYSMFFYWIYLARGKVATLEGAALSLSSSSSSLSVLGRALVLPQVVLLVYSSLSLAPTDLTFALFVQTFFFVALNKVITAQYFTWYLVLLPLCSERICWVSKSMMNAVAFLVASILFWLGNAFCLEMKGKPFHLQVWVASIGFFVANVNLLRVIINSYRGVERRASEKDGFSDANTNTKLKTT